MNAHPDRAGDDDMGPVLPDRADDMGPVLPDRADNMGPVLPDRADDDRDVGWGERAEESAGDAAHDRRLLEDRPPHHDGRSSW